MTQAGGRRLPEFVPFDHAPSSVVRFVVVGTSGSGKTTFAKALAAKLEVPRIELDALHWLPDWVEREPGEFRALVAQAIEPERWVVDGNYSVVRDILWPRATDIVWLNYSQATVCTRVLARTLRRSLTRERLWAGNTESLRRAFLTRDSILLWALNTYRRNRVKYARLREDPAFGHLRWHELRNAGDAARLLREAGAGA